MKSFFDQRATMKDIVIGQQLHEVFCIYGDEAKYNEREIFVAGEPHEPRFNGIRGKFVLLKSVVTSDSHFMKKGHVFTYDESLYDHNICGEGDDLTPNNYNLHCFFTSKELALNFVDEINKFNTGEQYSSLSSIIEKLNERRAMREGYYDFF